MLDDDAPLIAESGSAAVMVEDRAMEAEYSAIRKEMLLWQDRRFDLLKHSAAIVTGLLGFKIIAGSDNAGALSPAQWPLITVLLLLYLSTILLLTWYAGIANTKLAAYIQVFHEVSPVNGNAYNWERRLKKFKQIYQYEKLLTLNLFLPLVYLVFGFVSLLLPYASSGFIQPTMGWMRVLEVSAAPFLVTLLLVSFNSYPRERYKKKWEQLRALEGCVP